MSAITVRLHRAFLDALDGDVLAHGDVNTKPLDLDLALPLPQHLRLYLYSLVVGGKSRRGEFKAVLRVPGQGRWRVRNLRPFRWPACRAGRVPRRPRRVRVVGREHPRAVQVRRKHAGQGHRRCPSRRDRLGPEQRRALRSGITELVFACRSSSLPRAIAQRVHMDRGDDKVSGLATLALKTSYHKGRDDIANDFYLPALRRAIKYDRAVGYFRSAAFIIAWPALREFVAHGGRIRILCSQVLSAEDIEALDAGYAARVDETIAARLRDEVATLLADETMSEPARVLAALVATEVIEIKIAILRPLDGVAKTRIFHDKLGILRDPQGSVVIFKGSMNETWSGLAGDGNLESVDVACSWLGGRDKVRTVEETAYFEELWTNVYPGLDVRPFPDTAR